MGLIARIRERRGHLAAAVDAAMTTWAERAETPEDAQAFLDARDAIAGHVSRQALNDVANQPEGSAALLAEAPPGKPHPFLDWLTHGGGQWLYSIAKIIAAMFGLRLPPLPPIPPPPA